MHYCLRHSGRFVDEKLLAAKAADGFILMQSVTSTLMFSEEKKEGQYLLHVRH